MTTTSRFPLLIPILFVLIWSTGWIVARYAADYADPLTFLCARYAIAMALLAIFAVLAKAVWPKRLADWGHGLVSGVLLHAIYLGGVWWAIRQGLPASISALLAAVQPILTALLAPALVKERIGPLQWLGVLLGLCGLLVVLSPRLAGLNPDQLSHAALPILVNVLAMVSVTFGSFYQKRFIRTGDLRVVTILQYMGALAVTLPVAWLIEPMRIVWNTTMVATMAWSVLALSIGAISLLLILIRRGEVSKSAQLIYLIPPTAAVEAFILFGEALSLPQIAGMALTVLGVALASRR